MERKLEKSYGSKADNLSLLRQSGFNVPKFYVVSADIKDKLSSSTVENQIKAEFSEWVKSNNVGAVAVRSSSTQEDTKESSFAGQFTTVLDVQNGNELVDALREVFSSKQSHAYSTKSGEVHAIVQEFIEPDASGVIFSVNPANGNNEMVINTAGGRGTNVVEGHEVEQYFINRLNFKSFKKSDTQGADILTKPQIEELTSLTLQIESLFGRPQDIEWAIKNKVIYVLQARPITRINHLRLWDSSNISESFPGIVLPLTFSIARKGYLLGYKSQAYSAGLSWYELEAHHRTFDAMIGIFNGKMYYNLLNWYRFISLFPGNARNQKFLDDQIATQGEVAYQAPTQYSRGYRIRFYLNVLYRITFFRRELNRFYKKFEQFKQEMSRMPVGEDSQLLMLQYSHIEQVIIPQFGRTLDNDFIVMTYHGWLKRLLTKWLPDKPFEKNSIIGSITGVMSAEQALSLHQLADRIKSDKKAFKLLQDENFHDLDDYLKGSDVQKAIDEYLSVFGHRFAQDQKIEAPNPMLEPLGIYKVLKTYAKLDASSVEERIAKSQSTSKKMERELVARLNPMQRVMYRWLLKHLKRHLRLREKNRLLRGKVWGYMRNLFPKIGEAFVNEGFLKKKEDIYYLQIEEIYQVMQGSLIVDDLAIRIEKRREAYKEFKKVEMPERFITKSLPSFEKVEMPKLDTKSIKDSLTGLISSPGTVEGKALVLDEPVIPDEPYDILIARHTDPGWTPLIALAKGVIVEHGGMLSHAAIVTRELGIPSIIGVQDVTRIVKTGMHVRINAQSSSVEILDK